MESFSYSRRREQHAAESSSPQRPNEKPQGIALDRIANKNEKEEVISLFTCQLCQFLVKNPLIDKAKCENAFCKDCLEHFWKSTRMLKSCPSKCYNSEFGAPSRMDKVHLKSLEISCENKVHGCEEILSYDKLEEHEGTCKFKPTKCQAYATCGTILSRDKIASHESNCEFVQISCESCKQQIMKKDLPNHDCVLHLLTLLEGGAHKPEDSKEQQLSLSRLGENGAVQATIQRYTQQLEEMRRLMAVLETKVMEKSQIFNQMEREMLEIEREASRGMERETRSEERLRLITEQLMLTEKKLEAAERGAEHLKKQLLDARPEPSPRNEEAKVDRVAQEKKLKDLEEQIKETDANLEDVHMQLEDQKRCNNSLKDKVALLENETKLSQEIMQMNMENMAAHMEENEEISACLETLAAKCEQMRKENEALKEQKKIKV